MSIENPTTYAEWYWAQQVDANKSYDDAQELSLKPFTDILLSEAASYDEVSPYIKSVLGSLGTRGHFGLAPVAVGAGIGVVQQNFQSMFEPGLRRVSQAANRRQQTNIADLNVLNILKGRKRIVDPTYYLRSSSWGYPTEEAEMIYRASLPFPDVLSLIQWARYTSDDTQTFTRLQSKQDIPDEDFQIWDFLATLRLSESEIQSLFLRKYMDEHTALLELKRQGYRDIDAAAVLDNAYSIPNPTYLVQAALLEEIDTKELGNVVTVGGIHPDYAQRYVNALLSKPDPGDVIRYMLRTDPNLSELGRELKKLGIHPDYIDVFKTLAYPVPPIGDMITMAVREAFTPDIATRFGQYEDYPTELTKYAAMNGISEEWTKRYWAAHWSLPSPQQGFAMYQRGIIDEDTLHLLLRALDIMPFWRDRLTQLAYNPLTRIDVRRMYYIGSLNDQEVEKAYRDAGYSPDNARRLRDYVVRDTIRSQSGMSVTKVVTAYKNGYTDRASAYNQIASIGIRDDKISDILSRADIQLKWQEVKDGIAATQNEYRTENITEEDARHKLAAFHLDNTKINNLISRWDKDRKDEHKVLWTKTDTLALLKKKLITRDRAMKELNALGYNTERANALLAMNTSK